MLQWTSLMFVSVSYTHLDVYKRQAYSDPDNTKREGLDSTVWPKAFERMEPVSYTHLDVYKRQMYIMENIHLPNIRSRRDMKYQEKS